MAEQSRRRAIGKLRSVSPLYSLVLHHVHDHPVKGIHVLPNQVLEHDECFHQEILQEETTVGENWIKKAPRDGGSY